MSFTEESISGKFGTLNFSFAIANFSGGNIPYLEISASFGSNPTKRCVLFKTPPAKPAKIPIPAKKRALLLRNCLLAEKKYYCHCAEVLHFFKYLPPNHPAAKPKTAPANTQLKSFALKFPIAFVTDGSGSTTGYFGTCVTGIFDYIYLYEFLLGVASKSSWKPKNTHQNLEKLGKYCDIGLLQKRSFY